MRFGLNLKQHLRETKNTTHLFVIKDPKAVNVYVRLSCLDEQLAKRNGHPRCDDILGSLF